MSLQHAVLGVLEARPMTGYELTQMFESTARWVWAAPQSQIYPLLKKLEREGLIEGEDQVRGERLRRTVYSITPAGLEDLREWLGQDLGKTSPRDPLLVKALFFDMADPEDARRVLEAHIVELRHCIELWSVHRDRLLARDTELLRERLLRRDPADHERIARLKAHVFDFLIDSAALRVRWVNRTIEILECDRPAEIH
ncbi:PadR family transcriptional regulator [Rhodococcus sp. NCIMB 12038]|uniref:PadR family transcriptional regulator n=1 Tax=Rhodococcus sp. NCIMB 12038 TaxID=933800 RepID=UPI000B3CF2DC|nr:PadR family transcriptional regulator [Rhodococcus sp. NCIMB 12038]OUS79711.1 PadR family transcriptional regulator [Rhodococcus sp. NCIMB 12038]